MLRFEILGFPVEVHWTFWLVASLLGGGLYALEVGTLEAWSQFLVVVVLIFCCLLAHELGHALMARKFGRESQILLHSFGGLAVFPSQGLTRWENFWITAAGPAVNVLIGLAALGLFLSAGDGLPEFVLLVLLFLIWINFLWSMFNLLPLLPMDGGKLLYAVMGPRRQNFCRTVALFAGITSGVLAWQLGFVLASFFAFLLGFFNFTGKIRENP